MALWGVALAACGQNIGEPGVWVDIASIMGPLEPELADAPPMPLRHSLATDGKVRVVSWNVEFGANVEGLAAFLNADPELSAADILLLQEEESYPEEGASRAARLAEAIGMGHVYAPEREQRGGTHGVAILSVMPVENVQVMKLPFVSLPFSGVQRIMLAADVRIGDAVVRVMTTHLDTRLNIADRILQLRPALIGAPEKVILGGDLNTNPFVWAHGQVPLLTVNSVASSDQAALLDDWVRRLGFDTPTAELGPTQRAGGVLDLRLDHIYTRGVVATPGAVQRDVFLSDHWPVWIDIEVR